MSLKARHAQKVSDELHDGPEGGEHKHHRRTKGGRKLHRILLVILILLVDEMGTKMGMQNKSYYPKTFKKNESFGPEQFWCETKSGDQMEAHHKKLDQNIFEYWESFKKESKAEL